MILLALVLLAQAEPFHEARLDYESQSYKSAAKKFAPLVEEGDTLASVYVGLMALKGRGVPKDFERAAELLNQAAKAGDFVAQVALGHLYDDGRGVAKDAAQSHAWNQKAADQGYWAGQLNAGVDYATGRGVAKDCEAARRWIEKAAAGGEGMARHDVGAAIYSGCGYPLDKRKAFEVMRDAARVWLGPEDVKFFEESMENPDKYSFAARYSYYAVTQEEPPAGPKALDWIRKRAEAGDMYAQYAIAAALETGVGVAKDTSEAADWYAKSATAGLARSERALKAMAARGAISQQRLARALAGTKPAAAVQPGAAPRVVLSLKGKLAVLDLRNYTKELTRQNAQYFTDVVRQISLKLEPQLDVMTRENLLVLLSASGKKLEECEGECEVDTGRRIGADQIVSGEIQKLGSQFKLTLRLHDTAQGKLLASSIASGKSVEELDASVARAAEELFGAK